MKEKKELFSSEEMGCPNEQNSIDIRAQTFRQKLQKYRCKYSEEKKAKQNNDCVLLRTG